MAGQFAAWLAVYVFNSYIGSAIYYAGYVAATLAITAGLSKVSASLMGRPKTGANMQSRNIIVRDSIHPRTILYGEGMTGGVMVYINTCGEKNEYLDFVVAVAGHEVSEIGDVWFDDELIPASAINGGDPAGGAVTAYTDTTVSPNRDGRFRPRGGKTLAYVYKYLGTDTQAASSVLTESYPTEWTTDHRLRGVAYVHIRLRRNSEAYEQGPPQNFRFTFKGAKVYDPRKDGTNGGTGAHRYEIPSTWEYSRNAALCVADYLIGGSITNSATRTNMRGFGAATADVDWPSVIAAANVCDEQVLIPPAGSPSAVQPRYRCDGALSTGETTSENLEQLLTAMIGQVVYSSGRYQLFAGAYDTPALTLNETDLAGGVSYVTGTPRSDRYNAVKGVRWDSVTGQETEFLPRTSASYEADDGGSRFYRDIELPFTTDEYMAQRIAQIILRRSREQQTLIWKGNLGCLRVGVWETVSVTATELGITNKVFRCISRNIDMESEDAIVELTLREEFTTTYSDPLIADYGDLSPAEPQQVAVDALDPPIALTATSISGGIQFNITPDDSNGTNVLFDLAEYSADTPSSSATVIWSGSATAVAIPKADQVTRYYWVRARRNSSVSTYFPETTGVAGIALAAGEGPQGDPGVSVQLTRVHSSLFAYADGTVLTFDNANGYMRLYEGANLVDTANITFSVTGAAGCTGTINSAGYYAVTAMSADEASLALRAVYNAANYDALYTLTKVKAGYEILNSLPVTNLFEGRMVYLTTDDKLYRYTGTAWTTAVPAVDITGTLTGLQIGAGAIDITKFASGIRPVEIVGSLPATDLIEGRTVYLTTDNKLYRYDGAQWTAAVPSTDITGTLSDAQISALAASKITGQLTDAQIAALAAAKLTGQIVGTQITDGAISTAKIAAGAITSNEIAANTITAGDIAASTITSANIAAGTITGSNIAAGTIQATNIAASTITGDKIAANTIQGASIVSDSITAGQIAAGAISANELAANAVTAVKIAAGEITADKIASNTITSNQIQTGTITAAKMATNTITAVSGVLADAVITTAKIQDLAVDTIKIANGAITSGYYVDIPSAGSGPLGAYLNYLPLVINGVTAQLPMTNIDTSGRVVIWLSGSVENAGPDAEEVILRCIRSSDNGVLVGTPQWRFLDTRASFSHIFVDNAPNATSMTYTVQIANNWTFNLKALGYWTATTVFGSVFKK